MVVKNGFEEYHKLPTADANLHVHPLERDVDCCVYNTYYREEYTKIHWVTMNHYIGSLFKNPKI